jgi:rubrerythrin
MDCYGGYDRKLLDLFMEASAEEKRNHRKCRSMIEMTCSQELIEQIHHAYMDDIKHYDIFTEIYEELTGKDIQILSPEYEQQDRFIEAVKTGINEEFVAVEFFREIRVCTYASSHVMAQYKYTRLDGTNSLRQRKV